MKNKELNRYDLVKAYNTENCKLKRYKEYVINYLSNIIEESDSEKTIYLISELISSLWMIKKTQKHITEIDNVSGYELSFIDLQKQVKKDKYKK